VQQVRKEVAAEWVIPHVGHHGAPVGVCACLVERIDVDVAKACFQHRDDDRVPRGIDERFVGENGVRECWMRQEQRSSKDQRGESRDMPPLTDLSRASSADATAPRGEEKSPSQQ